MAVLDHVVDLSVPIYEGMPADDLGPKFWVRLSHAASRQLYQNTQSREGRVFLTTDHVGTHLDGPLRFDPQGASVERLPLDRVIRPRVFLDLRTVGRGGTIGPRELEQAWRGAGTRRRRGALDRTRRPPREPRLFRASPPALARGRRLAGALRRRDRGWGLPRPRDVRATTATRSSGRSTGAAPDRGTALQPRPSAGPALASVRRASPHPRRGRLAGAGPPAWSTGDRGRSSI